MIVAAVAVALFFFPQPAPAGEPDARAELRNEKGEAVGSVLLRAAPGGVLLVVRATGLPPGTHGFHIHETGKCEPPFQSAGGHFNPSGAKHGLLNPEGPHAGDLPNVTVAADGTLHVELFTPLVVLGSGTSGAKNVLFDADGSALVIHAGADDHRTDPSGHSGGRIACGVIAR
jgi:Cu-Zn family superoxide dismutase